MGAGWGRGTQLPHHRPRGRGHPIGSSGVRMINNIHDQLGERAGKMQVKRADMGLAHNLRAGPGPSRR